MTYFATFVAGCGEIISQRLKKFPASQLRILELMDGLVLFDSSLAINQLSELRFFNNVYALIHDFGQSKEPLADLLSEASTRELPSLPFGDTFSVRVSQANQLVAADRSVALRAIAARTGKSPTSHDPVDEFLLLRRDDGRTLWGWRLPRAGFKRRRVENGEIRPELAHILGIVASIDSQDVVLDPFAGFGGIVRECLQGFHAREVLAVEKNEHLIPHLKSIPRLIAIHGDAGQLAHIHTRGVDRVITDPPWGDFTHQPENELRGMYRSSLKQMHRVLRQKGAAVILTAVHFLPELATEAGFEVIKTYPVLVSGKKAVIYKLRKIS